MKIAWIAAHRAIGDQSFRKKELCEWIKNIKNVIKENAGIIHRIYIIEQADKKEWNRGILYNAGYQVAATDDRNFLFVNCNTDYTIPEEPLPNEFYEHKEGFLDLHGYDGGLGSFCAFYLDAFEGCNGFPNNFWGWGGEDYAIKKRIELVKLPIHRPSNLYGKWIKEKRDHPRDFSKNDHNTELANQTTKDTMWESGLNNTAHEIKSIHRYDEIVWVRVQC